MLVKGIIEEKVDMYSYRVRIPFLNKVEGDSNPTLTEDLSVAAISTIPGIHSVFEQGDVVFIDFENDDFSDPVILGLLDRTSDKTSYNNIDTTSLNVDLTANLPYETYIGDITPFELSSLRGIKGNLQEQLSIQENTIETYMCEYGETSFSDVSYQFNQGRALFVSYSDLNGYTGTIALTRINTTTQNAEFSGIVSNTTDNSRKFIITIKLHGDTWSNTFIDVVPPGLIWDKSANIASLANLQTQMLTWFDSMPTESERFFYFTPSGNWSPFNAGSAVTVSLQKGNASGQAVFYGRKNGAPSTNVVTTMTKYGASWGNFQDILTTDNGTNRLWLSASTGSGTAKYSIFYRSTNNTGTSNNSFTFLVGATDNFTTVESDMWVVSGRIRSSQLSLSSRKIMTSSYGANPVFGYYQDSTDNNWYVGVSRPNYSAHTFVILLETEGNGLTIEQSFREHSTSSSAPTGWVEVDNSRELLPSAIIPYYGSSVTYSTFLRIPKLTSGSSKATWFVGGDEQVNRATAKSGAWAIVYRNYFNTTDNVPALSIKVYELLAPLDYSNKEFGYYEDSNYYYIGMKRPSYAGYTRVIPLEGASSYSSYFGNWSTSTTQPTGWTTVDIAPSYARHLGNWFQTYPNSTSNRPTTANVASDNYGGIRKFIATGSMTTAKPPTDGHIIHMDWDNGANYASQLWVSNGDPTRLAIRAQRGAFNTTNPSGVWSSWREMEYQALLVSLNDLTTRPTTDTLLGGRSEWIYG